MSVFESLRTVVISLMRWGAYTLNILFYKYVNPLSSVKENLLLSEKLARKAFENIKHYMTA
jgi:hypothetical protein